jgi:hypothetical protein
MIRFQKKNCRRTGLKHSYLSGAAEKIHREMALAFCQLFHHRALLRLRLFATSKYATYTFGSSYSNRGDSSGPIRSSGEFFLRPTGTRAFFGRKYLRTFRVFPICLYRRYGAHRNGGWRSPQRFPEFLSFAGNNAIDSCWRDNTRRVLGANEVRNRRTQERNLTAPQVCYRHKHTDENFVKSAHLVAVLPSINERICRHTKMFRERLHMFER